MSDYAQRQAERIRNNKPSRNGRHIPPDQYPEDQRGDTWEPPPESWAPFPLASLPDVLRSYADAGASAIDCDPSYVALPLLATCAAAIGNTRRIQVKRGWSEPAIVWAAIVGESGTAKSPSLDLARDLPRRRQADAFRRHAAATAEWEETPKDERGRPPVCERCVVDDTTFEALAPILAENWRGVLLSRDELAGWLGGFDRYARARGGEAAKWIEVFGGRPVVIDRKTNRQTIYVPRAAVSVCGGIQPGILRRLIGQEHRDSGLLARLLLARPPRRAKRWTEAEVSEAVRARVQRAYDQLYLLAPDLDDDLDPQPRLVRLTREAREQIASYVDEHGQEQLGLDDDLVAAWSKLEGYAARLALVCHLVRWADGETVDPDVCDLASVEAGITLSRWFGGEARRVYGELEATDADRERLELLVLIRHRGGFVTARDLGRASRRYRSPGAAEEALDGLARSGLGQWHEAEVGESGGRPTRVFRLSASR